MPKNSVGLRLTSEVMSGSDASVRFVPEVMAGLAKNLMAHSAIYISDLHQKAQKFEGYSFYAKYRFLSIDSLQRHFRMAAYGRYSSSSNPLYSGETMVAGGATVKRALDEINLEGDNTGVQGGIVLTQLLHKLALSASVNYNRAFDNQGGYDLLPGQAKESIGYTFSAGYLKYPKVYTSYSQPNLNLYLEFLGKSNPGKGQRFMEAAPALQLILNSRTRIDLSKRIQLYGNMNRITKNMLLFRIEHNFFNVF